MPERKRNHDPAEPSPGHDAKPHMSVLASVIIPTAARPAWLPRAIDSALQGLPAGSVEIVVVPNGPDRSWHATRDAYAANPSVHFAPIDAANANLARNMGLALARGQFIRFLDDDDYLFPEAAVRQYQALLSSEADVCAGGATLVDAHNRRLHDWHQPEDSDFCSAVFGPRRNTLPLVHVFRTSSLEGCRWNPDDAIRQDTHWLMDLCSNRELDWIRDDAMVGAWVQHKNSRISLAQKTTGTRMYVLPGLYYDRDRGTADRLLAAHAALAAQGRLTAPRSRAIAEGLWGCIHASYFTDPPYWTRMGAQARAIDPQARPHQPLYRWPLIRHLDPMTVQRIMAPKRAVSRLLRYLKKRY